MIRGLFCGDTWFIRTLDFQRLCQDANDEHSLLRFHKINFVACRTDTLVQLLNMADDHVKSTQTPISVEKALAFVKFTEGMDTGVTTV